MNTQTKTVVRRRMGAAFIPAEGATSAGDLMSVIKAAALDPRCDVGKMRELLNMAKELEAEEARLVYVRAKLDLTSRLPTINKDGKIEFKDKGAGKALLKFASFENINDIIKPLLEEFDFDLWFSSEPGVAGMINVIGHLDHGRGHTRQTVFPMPHDASGGKSGAQGWASAFSFGKRITTIGLLNIQTKAIEDRDRDGNEGTFKRSAGGGLAEVPEAVNVSAGQIAEIKIVMESAGIPEASFCSHYEIATVADLPADLFKAALAAMKTHAAQRAAKAKARPNG